jgi:hypothetical protein
MTALIAESGLVRREMGRYQFLSESHEFLHHNPSHFPNEDQAQHMNRCEETNEWEGGKRKSWRDWREGS